MTVVEAGHSSCQPLSAITGRRRGRGVASINCVEHEENGGIWHNRWWDMLAGVILSERGNGLGQCQHGVSALKCSLQVQPSSAAFKCSLQVQPLKCSLVQEARL